MIMDIEFLTDEVKKLAVETGVFIREQRSVFCADRVETKRSHDYVSYVDKEAEKRIVERLSSLLPEAGFIAEEGSASCSQSHEYVWVVDPLDGTTNFIHDNAPYCVSIALRSSSGETLLGIVYECNTKELFWAHHKSAAYLNDKQISVSSVDTLDQSLCILGLPYNADYYRPFVAELTSLLYGNTCSLRNLGSAAIELCYVACGRFDVYIEGCLSPWDVAAGLLILKQAGGKATDFSNGTLFKDGKEVVATNEKVHDELLAVVEKARNKAFL